MHYFDINYEDMLRAKKSFIQYHKAIQDECIWLQMVERLRPMVMRYGVDA